MTTKSKPLKVKIGSPVPYFSLPSTGAKKFNLKEYKNKNLVFYFYPKDSTPGCTLEGRDFTKLNKEFKRYDTEVFGISRDSVKSHENFRSKEEYTIDLLSDTDEKVCHLFDVIKKKNLYGRMSKGIERSTFFIDKKGKLNKEWRKVKVAGHAQEVLDYVKENSEKSFSSPSL